MLDDRNLSVHKYNDALAEAIYQRIRARDAGAFHVVSNAIKHAKRP